MELLRGALCVRRPSFSILESVIETAICLHSARKWRTQRGGGGRGEDTSSVPPPRRETAGVGREGRRRSVKVVHHHWRHRQLHRKGQGKRPGRNGTLLTVGSVFALRRMLYGRPETEVCLASTSGARPSGNGLVARARQETAKSFQPLR